MRDGRADTIAETQLNSEGTQTSWSPSIHPPVGAPWPVSSPAPCSPGCSCRTAARPVQNACERRNNNQYDKLLECVTAAGVREHLEAFQAIADVNGGTRADQTPGYTASVDYVVDTMVAAGWDVDGCRSCTRRTSASWSS